MELVVTHEQVEVKNGVNVMSPQSATGGDQGDLKIISEMFKKFLEISNGCENWDVFDLKIENQNLKQENEWLKHQVDRLKKKEE